MTDYEEEMYRQEAQEEYERWCKENPRSARLQFWMLAVFVIGLIQIIAFGVEW